MPDLSSITLPDNTTYNIKDAEARAILGSIGLIGAGVTGSAFVFPDVPTAASINSSGLITFSDNDNEELFTLQLPIYNGSVAEGSSVSTDILVVNDTSGVLDKTWQEILDAFITRGVVINISRSQKKISVIEVYVDNDNVYRITAGIPGESYGEEYSANGASDYPEMV